MKDIIFKYGDILAQDENYRKLVKIQIIKNRLNELSQDIIQAQAGAIFDDLEERKAEFQELHNELRALQGKEAREYIKANIYKDI